MIQSLLMIFLSSSHKEYVVHKIIISSLATYTHIIIVRNIEELIVVRLN